MSRPQYAVKELYTGTGSLDEYTFDFKITNLSQLLVIEVDDDGVETERVRGDDETYLDSVTFDAILGGGTVFLADNLASGYTLILLLADDEPVQNYEFRNKTSFTLRRFEDAIDAIVGAVQRLSYLAKQSLRIHDIDEEEDFNGQLPSGVMDQGDKILIVNADGTGFDYGPDWNDIPASQSSADDAQADATQALADAGTAQAAAEAAQADATQAIADAAAAQADATQALSDVGDAVADAAAAQASAEAAQEAAEEALEVASNSIMNAIIFG